MTEQEAVKLADNGQVLLGVVYMKRISVTCQRYGDFSIVRIQFERSDLYIMQLHISKCY